MKNVPGAEIARVAHERCIAEHGEAAAADHDADAHLSSWIYAYACADIDTTPDAIVDAIRELGIRDDGSYLAPHYSLVADLLRSRA
jgi:hypothetical protein